MILNFFFASGGQGALKLFIGSPRRGAAPLQKLLINFCRLQATVPRNHFSFLCAPLCIFVAKKKKPIVGFKLFLFMI